VIPDFIAPLGFRSEPTLRHAPWETKHEHHNQRTRLPLLFGAGKMIRARFQMLLNLLAVLDFSRPSQQLGSSLIALQRSGHRAC